VPFYVYAPSLPELSIDKGVEKPRLANIAATVLQLLGYKAPADYERALLAL
jgi:bisphosphoglycerate-independent phosphoglycerate mutase (AlkP superfamily)